MTEIKFKDVMFMPTLEVMQNELGMTEKNRGSTRLFYGYSIKAFLDLAKDDKKNARKNWFLMKAQIRGEKNVNHTSIALVGRIWKTVVFVIAVLGAALLAYGLIHGHLSHTGFNAAIKDLLANPKNLTIFCLAGGVLGGGFYSGLSQRDINDIIAYRNDHDLKKIEENREPTVIYEPNTGMDAN